MNPSPTLLHDPGSETATALRRRRSPPPSLNGRTVALFDIGKARADEFLDYLEPRLVSRLRAHGVATARFAKPTNAKPAAPAIIGSIAEGADVVVEALAD